MLNIILGRYAQPAQRPRHPRLKNFFQFVPGAGRLIADFPHFILHRPDAFFHRSGFLFGGFLHLVIHRLSFLNQRIKELTAFFLSPGKRTQPRQPDLAGEVAGIVSQLMFKPVCFHDVAPH